MHEEVARLAEEVRECRRISDDLAERISGMIESISSEVSAMAEAPKESGELLAAVADISTRMDDADRRISEINSVLEKTAKDAKAAQIGLKREVVGKLRETSDISSKTKTLVEARYQATNTSIRELRTSMYNHLAIEIGLAGIALMVSIVTALVCFTAI